VWPPYSKRYRRARKDEQEDILESSYERRYHGDADGRLPSNFDIPPSRSQRVNGGRYCPLRRGRQHGRATSRHGNLSNTRRRGSGRLESGQPTSWKQCRSQQFTSEEQLAFPFISQIGMSDVSPSPGLLHGELSKEECVNGYERGGYGLATDGGVSDSVIPNVKFLPMVPPNLVIQPAPIKSRRDMLQ
jgi:hypothetical protein